MTTPQKENRQNKGQKALHCTPDRVKRAYELSACLFLDSQIYESLDISHDTFYRWKRENSDFAEALKKGRAETLEKITKSAIEKCNNDPLMSMFMLKNKAKYIEHNQAKHVKLKKNELILKEQELKIKEKELMLKSDKFAADLSEKFNLNKEEVLEVLNRYSEPLSDVKPRKKSK